jgi:ParB/RepB/Spo0J family partition protein
MDVAFGVDRITAGEIDLFSGLVDEKHCACGAVRAQGPEIRKARWMAETITAAGVPRTIALSAITVREGFNPRLRFDAAELERLTKSIRKRGVLQPLLVQPAACEGECELVDGERRYRAAFKAGITEIPVLIRPRGEETGGLVDALAANFHNASNTPVEEAFAVARLLEAGLTRRSVSERLEVSRDGRRVRRARRLPADGVRAHRHGARCKLRDAARAGPPAPKRPTIRAWFWDHWC